MAHRALRRKKKTSQPIDQKTILLDPLAILIDPLVQQRQPDTDEQLTARVEIMAMAESTSYSSQQSGNNTNEEKVLQTDSSLTSSSESDNTTIILNTPDEINTSTELYNSQSSISANRGEKNIEEDSEEETVTHSNLSRQEATISDLEKTTKNQYIEQMNPPEPRVTITPSNLFLPLTERTCKFTLPTQHNDDKHQLSNSYDDSESYELPLINSSSHTQLHNRNNDTIIEIIKTSDNDNTSSDREKLKNNSETIQKKYGLENRQTHSILALGALAFFGGIVYLASDK